MTDETYFPLEFIAYAQPHARALTCQGIYLRWFVQPFLGMVGVDPLQNAPDCCGYRLFAWEHRDGKPDLVQLGKPINDDSLIPVADWNDWWMLHDQDNRELALPNVKEHELNYLRFNYLLFPNQTLILHYETSAGAKVEVPLDYRALDLQRSPRRLTYAIHTDAPNDYLTKVSFEASVKHTILGTPPGAPVGHAVNSFETSAGHIILGSLVGAKSESPFFYAWSKPGNNNGWQEIGLDAYLIRSPGDPNIIPTPFDQFDSILKDFYSHYYRYGAALPATTGQLPGLPETVWRTYDSAQYRKLLTEGVGVQGEIQISSQDAAALVSLDPALAYVLGLFRVLKFESLTEPTWLKLQGQWPDGRRFCIYQQYDPNQSLIPPAIVSPKASQVETPRALYDFRTYRHHQPLHAVKLSWKAADPVANSDVQLEPVAYAVLRKQGTQEECVSPFYIPPERDKQRDGAVHLLDWYTHYPDTDIRKVLEGSYSCTIVGFDIFGQISGSVQANAAVSPLHLKMGEITGTRVTLYRQGYKSTLEIPLAVKKERNNCHLWYDGNDGKADTTTDLHCRVSFFWPHDARMVWNRNRATAKPSLKGFALYYLADVPLFVPVVCAIKENSLDQVVVELTVSDLSRNNPDLWHLFEKLGAVQRGKLDSTLTKAILQGGTLNMSRICEIGDVEVEDSGKIKLTCQPAASALDGEAEDSIVSGAVQARLYWNLDARTTVDLPVGWKPMNLGCIVKPQEIVDVDLRGVSRKNNTPKIEAKTNSLGGNGVVAYQPDEEPLIDRDGHVIPYGFSFSLRQDHKLASYDRLLVIPIAPSLPDGLEPGQHQRADLLIEDQAYVPEHADVLFSTDRYQVFAVQRVKADERLSVRQSVTFWGDPLSHIQLQGVEEQEVLLFPNPSCRRWLVIPPNDINVEIPLREFLADRTFDEQHYLASTVAFKVVASADEDKEVTDSPQGAILTKKLAFVEHLSPPAMPKPDKKVSQPAFGIRASDPGVDGISLIRVYRIFEGYDLSKLHANLHYFLYQLPAQYVVADLPLAYAQDGNVWKRNLEKLQKELDTLRDGLSDYFCSPKIQELFSKHSTKINQEALNIDAFVNMPVTLAGKSNPVMLYAIRAYNHQTGLESEGFQYLSKPVYVEDQVVRLLPAVRFTFSISDGTIQLDLSISPATAHESPLGLHGYDVFFTTKEVVNGQYPDLEEFEKVEASEQVVKTIAPTTSKVEFAIQLDLAVPDFNVQDGSAHCQVTVMFEPKLKPNESPSTLYYCIRARDALGNIYTWSWNSVNL